MGNIGLIFNLKDYDLVIFVKKNNFKDNIVIGTKSFKKEKSKFKYLSKNLKLYNFLVLENSKFKSAKIALYNKKVIDFEFLTFWFGTKDYKKLRQLFETKDNISTNDIITKVIEIYKYF